MSDTETCARCRRVVSIQANEYVEGESIDGAYVCGRCVTGRELTDAAEDVPVLPLSEFKHGRFEFPNGTSFDGHEIFDAHVAVYLTTVDSFFVFETGPLRDAQTGVETNDLDTHSFSDFERLSQWLNDDEMAVVRENAERVRRERGDGDAV